MRIIEGMTELEELGIDRTPKGAFEKRVHEIDFARGLLICLVLMDHIFNNLKNHGATWCGGPWIFANGFFDWYWTGIPRMIIQPMALILFCFISGISCSFSKSNWKRAIETICVWAIIFVATLALQTMSDINGWGMNVRIDFNIIGVLGFSTLAYCLVEKRSWKILLAVILLTALIYFYVMPNVKQSLIDAFGSTTFIRAGHDCVVPNVYAPIFWMPAVQGTGDYVALFPYIGFFFAGALFGRKFYAKEKKSYFKSHNFERPICFLGRHTLLIYLGHMPIVMGIFALVDVIVKAFK